MFDEQYYKDIWGTVHRHDYCAGLADYLISKYGKVKILDIGTGCGYLVKVLRERGCDAWGIDISEYAVSQSDDPQHVKLADVRSIPFEDNSFDVVHSQGLWGYFPEEDIDDAWRECKRVGIIQHHTIDFNDTDPTHKYFISRSKAWWDRRLK